MNISLRVDGLDRLSGLASRYARGYSRMIKTIVSMLAFGVVRRSKQSVVQQGVVDTGRTLQSIQAFFIGDGAVAKPGTAYAIFPHEGLGTSSGYGRRPFMEIGAKDTVRELSPLVHASILAALRQSI